MNKLLIVSLAAALGGCSMMPEYLRPAAPVAPTWNAPAEGARKIADTDWKTYFPDQRLHGLIQTALEYNRDLRIATARVAEARALYGVQRADRLPTLNIQGGRNAALTPGDLSSTGKPLETQRYDAGFGIPFFELDFWGRVASLSEAARASYLATEEAQRSFRLSLIADVANAYFSLLEMEDRTGIARDTVSSREESRNLISKRREFGIAGDLDYLQADSAYELARADLANLERQRAAAFNALVLLVGLPGPELNKQLPPGRRLTEQQVIPDLVADLPSEVLLRRPDILGAEQQLIAANANIGAARAAFFPRIGLTAVFGTASAAMSGLFESGQRSWSFQPTLSMPLFDFGRTSANVDVAEARKVVTVAQYEKTIQQAFREVDDLLTAREQLVKQLAAQEAAEKSQNERLRLAEARYKVGVSGYLEVLDAQREAYSAQQNSVQVRRTLLTTAANLYKALGGGGENPKPTQATTSAPATAPTPSTPSATAKAE